MTTLDELRKRAGAADAPTDELFQDIAYHVLGAETPSQFHIFCAAKAWMDAAIALVEAKLPGWTITMAYWQDEGWCSFNLFPGGPDSYGVSDPKAASSGHIYSGPAIALLLALLSALEKESAE